MQVKVVFTHVYDVDLTNYPEDKRTPEGVLETDKPYVTEQLTYALEEEGCDIKMEIIDGPKG